MSSVDWDDKELQEALANLKAKLPERVEECMEQACLKVQADAMELCPKDTGELRRSIQTEVKNNGDDIEGRVGSNLYYAPFVHQGTGIYAKDGGGRKEVPWVYYSDKLGRFVSTKGIKSTPFLENAFNNNKSSIADYFKGVISDA